MKKLKLLPIGLSLTLIFNVSCMDQPPQEEQKKAAAWVLTIGAVILGYIGLKKLLTPTGEAF